MALYELDCHDCGEPCQVKRKDGKYCRSCSLLRVLTHAAKLSRQKPKCRACGDEFRPLNKTDYSLCGTCTPLRDTATPQPCVLCKETRPIPYDGVAVCLPCLKSPDGRQRTFGALQKGRDARTAKNVGRPRREITRVDRPNRDTAPART